LKNDKIKTSTKLIKLSYG